MTLSSSKKENLFYKKVSIFLKNLKTLAERGLFSNLSQARGLNCKFFFL